MKVFGLHKSIYQASRINGHVPSKIALAREKEVKIFIDLVLLGRRAQEAAEVIGLSRASLFRWKKAYLTQGIVGLEPESRKPKHVRKPKWDFKLINRLVALRKEFPAWGKDKLHILLLREGFKVSESTVGRILSSEIQKGHLQKFTRKKVCWVRRAPTKRYAVRGVKGYRPQKAGDIIQIDTMHLELGTGQRVKQFTASCPVSRWSVVDVYKNATSKNAALFLEKVIDEMPFFITGIQIDGGSEFMGEFEEACRRHQLKLYVLPPRSPKLNGSVERSNGTWRYEFYSCYDLPFEIGELRK